MEPHGSRGQSYRSGSADYALDSSDRLFEAIENAKREVNKSREVLQAHFNSTTPAWQSASATKQASYGSCPTTGGVPQKSDHPSPTPSWSQEYSSSMGQPVPLSDTAYQSSRLASIAAGTKKEDANPAAGEGELRGCLPPRGVSTSPPRGRGTTSLPDPPSTPPPQAATAPVGDTPQPSSKLPAMWETSPQGTTTAPPENNNQPPAPSLAALLQKRPSSPTVPPPVIDDVPAPTPPMACASEAEAASASLHAEVRTLKEGIAQRDAVIARQEAEILQLRKKVASLEKDLSTANSEAERQIMMKRQEFAQQKAALLLRYGITGDGHSQGTTSPARHDPPNPPAAQPPPQPPPTTFHTPTTPRNGEVVKVPRARGPSMKHGPKGVVPPGRPASGRSRTPDPHLSSVASSSGVSPAPRSSSRRGFAGRRDCGRTAKEAAAAATAAAAADLQGGELSEPTSPVLRQSAVDKALGVTLPPDAQSWRAAGSHRRRSLQTAHPCTAAFAAEIDMTVDASLPPCSASGVERKEVCPGLISIMAPVITGGTRITLFNGMQDTQFNLRHTFNDPGVRPAHPHTSKTSSHDFGVFVLPGETKPFVEGPTGSSKMSLSFGPIETKFLDSLPRPPQPELRRELAAVRQQIPPDLRRISCDDLAELCRRSGQRFVDLTFPPLPTSVARTWESRWPLPQSVWEWRRKSGGVLWADRLTSAIVTGSLAGTAVPVALACAVRCNPQLVERCFAVAQDLPHGVYRVLLRSAGWWQTVVVDDYFPTNVSGEPMYSHTPAHRSSDGDLWAPVLEKAMAKLHGSYAALQDVDPSEMLSSTTNSPSVELNFSDDEALWKELTRLPPKDVVIFLRTSTAATSLPPNTTFRVVEVRHARGTRLIRVEDPLDGWCEWKGDWCSSSSKWTPELRADVPGSTDPSQIWMAVETAMGIFSAGTACFLSASQLSAVSVACHCEGGSCDTVLQVNVEGNGPFELWAGVHQRAAAGLPDTDVDRAYAGMLVGVVRQRKEGSEDVDVLALSNHGHYVAGREVYAHATMRHGPATLYVIPQAYHPIDKAFVLTLHCSDHARVQVKFKQLQKTGARMLSHPHIASFNPRSLCPTQGSRTYQVRLPGTLPFDGAGQSVRWSRERTGTTLGGGCVSQIRRQVQVRPEPPPSTGLSSTPLDVVVVAGRGLSLSDGSVGDPYCEVKLVRLSEQGEWASIPGTLRRTRYVMQSADPTWGERVEFSEVATTDYLFLKCFDKDLFRQDEMGEILLSLAEFIHTLSVGGAASINWYPLQGQMASGEIQLSIAIPHPSARL